MSFDKPKRHNYDRRWDLTRDQMAAIDSQMNFSDAHNRMALPPLIAEQLRNGLFGALWEKADSTAYSELVDEFVVLFARLSSSSLDKLPRENIHLCYASSVATSILANALWSLGMRVALIEPTFDNIADLLRQAGVPLTSIGERQVLAPIHPIEADCLFVTTPNNPTGQSLDYHEMNRLFAWASDADILLILDRSFALFDENSLFDPYELAARYPRLSLVIIEDTGKIMPSLDLKLGLLAMPTPGSESGRRLQESIEHHYSSLLLNVSPFTIAFTSVLCREAAAGDLEHIRRGIAVNRDLTRSSLTAVGVMPSSLSEHSTVSVELLDVSSFGASANVAHDLEGFGVHVLAADKFFWSAPETDSGLIRIALARRPELMGIGIEQVCKFFASRSTI